MRFLLLPLMVGTLGTLGLCSANQRSRPVVSGADPGLDPVPSTVLVERDLVGKSLAASPWFQLTQAVNQGATVEIALDAAMSDELAGSVLSLFVVAHRGPDARALGRELVDVRGGAQEIVVAEGGWEANRFVVDTGTLDGWSGDASVGVGYDVVLDRDGSKTLSPGDVIDGLGRTPGFTVLPDLAAPGPYTPVEELFNGGGTFQRLDVYWPAEIAGLGERPLVIVSHGNGHNYMWYDHIGNHLASWGYVVVSHANNTGPGVNAASNTTLTNVELFLGSLDLIAGGVLRERVDAHQMVWIGHSRGGEGIIRAYNKLKAGSALATLYSAEDVRLLSSIAPTDFRRGSPGRVPFHLWTGGADRDVNGCANCDICQTFHFFERADGQRMSISLHGVGHGDFHDGGGSSVASGACRVGRADTHAIMKGTLLPLLTYVLQGDEACGEYLKRSWEDLRPIGAPDDNPCVVVDLQYQDSPERARFVVDNFQEAFVPELSSSGGTVRMSLASYIEGRLDDNNTTFTPTASDPMNGMTMARAGDDSRGAVFEWDGTDEWILFELSPNGGAWLDVRGFEALSFRATQATRDALTDVLREDLVFQVRLWDRAGGSSTLPIDVYGSGIVEPYLRTGCGSGAGWANEFETVRLPLTGFQAHEPSLDLARLVAVEFLFGPSHGSGEGRIGLDEIEFVQR